MHKDLSSPASSPTRSRPPLCLSLLAALIAGLFAADATHAQLLPNLAAPAEQRPSVQRTANGIPQIDITRPSAAGVSVNQFRQFDVDAQGVVVNNGRGASLTSIAGWVSANRALVDGGARVIVNEVRSSDPSLLQGYVEIAGGKADLIIANPAGISCNGCGFIHASRVQLATAKPNFDDGKLAGYTMGSGELQVAGRGLDASRVDALALLTQAARINAGIWAHTLEVELRAPATAQDGLAPSSFALDVANIGGMYANRIWLVGSAHGLGARNAGTLSASESLVVSMDGKLENSASIDARDLKIQATSIDNVAHGKILGERIALQADRIANAGHPDASPVIAAAADLDLGARVLENTDQATIFAGADMRIGRQLDGDSHATGKAERVLNRYATIESLGKLDIHTGLLQNLNGGVEMSEVQVSGPQRRVYVQPEGDSRKYLPDELEAAGLEKTHTYSRTEYVVDRTEHESRVINSRPASIIAGGDMHLVGEDLVNENSRIIAGGELTGTLDNLRTIETPGTTRIRETGTSQIFLVKKLFFDSLYRTATGPILPYTPADEIKTLRQSLSITTDKQAGKLPSPAFDVAASRLASDGSSLFRINPGTGPLFVTDPRFTQYRQWLTSDWMLSQLDENPERLQKRIGDGYVEQRIIREQIAQLTGRRFLPGQDNDEAQYAALMASGVHQASALQLTPGIALTASQIAKLTADIVWLVEQEINIPARDGQAARTERVLVPRVYLLPRAGDLDSSGALISARRVVMSVADAIDNAGTINGSDGLLLQAHSISNSGKLSGDTALISASEDLTIHGGEVSTRHDQWLLAGRDIAVTSTTRDSARSSATRHATSDASRTGIDRVAVLHVDDEGKLQLLAGRDIALDAALLRNDGDGDIAVTAGRDLRLGTIATRFSVAVAARGSANLLREAHDTETGTLVQADGAVSLAAGQDLDARAASIESTGAAVSVSAVRDLAIVSGEGHASYTRGTEFRSSGWFSSSSSTRRVSSERQDALASSISGKSVDVGAGRDLMIAGSDITSDLATRLQAGRDTSIVSAMESSRSESFRHDTESGFLSGPGLSIGIGSRRQQQSNEVHRTRQRGSLIGTMEGDVHIAAGGEYAQKASKVAAPAGSVSITATNIDVSGGTDTIDSMQASSFSQSGLSISFSNPVIDAGRSLENLNSLSQQTNNSRTKALAIAAAGLSVTNAAKQVSKDPEHAGGLTVAVTIGSSKSQASATEHATRVAPSVVAASGDVHIGARGSTHSLRIAGSQVHAADSAVLRSEGDLTLEAQANTSTRSTSNHSSSTGIGLAASIGKEGTGLGIIVSASKAKGDSAGDDLSWTNTEVTASKQVSLQSKADTTLTGAKVEAPTVRADIGGNLSMESLQDRSHYDSHQQSRSGSITIPVGGNSGPAAQVNAAKSAIRSDYLSANEASGIEAGDGGFQVQVAGMAELRGAAIASSETAVQSGANQFSSSTLAISNLNNREDYEAKASGIGIGAGRNPQGDYAPQGSNAGLGHDSGHQSSVTTAGISGIAGDKSVRSGDASTGLKKMFDAERVAKEINAQVTITQEFSGQAYKAVGDYFSEQRAALKNIMDTSKDDQERRKAEASMDQLRREEQVMNVLIGAVIGMGGTATTKEGLSSAAEKMRTVMIEDSKKFRGITDGTTTITNISGPSAGIRSDEVKLGGTRADLDFLCGKNNERCVVLKNEFGQAVLDANGKTQLVLDKNGMVQFDKEAANLSLAGFLDTAEGKKMFGLTGGIQGVKGTLFGVPYEAGSWQDTLIESFSGAHDLIGGKLLGLYDESGNIKRGMTDSSRSIHDKLSTVALIPSAPFAASEMLPPAVWTAISILLQNAK